MRPDLPNLNQATAFDERLREIPAQRDAIEQAAARGAALLQEARRGGDAHAILQILGYLGDACRVLGRVEEAEVLLTEADTTSTARQ